MANDAALSPPRSRETLTLILCLLVAAFEGVDLQAAGVVVPVIKPLFQFAVSELKWFLAASTIGLVFGAWVGGRLADVWGRKTALMIAVALFGIFSVATALATSKSQLIEARLLTGFGLGGALPNLIALTAEAAHAARRRTAVALMYCGMPFGGGCASLLSMFGATSSWHNVFYIGGLAPIALLPLLWFALPDSHEFNQARASGEPAKFWQALFGEGRAARTLLLWVASFGALLVLYLLLNWLPSLMVSRGLSKPQAAWVQMVFNLAGIGGVLLAGFLVTRDERNAIWVFFAGTILALILLALVPPNFGAELLAGAVIGAAVMGGQSTLYAVAPGLYPTRVRGTGVGATISAGRLGSVAGPLVAGIVLQSGGSATNVLFTLIPVSLVSLVAAVALTRR